MSTPSRSFVQLSLSGESVTTSARTVLELVADHAGIELTPAGVAVDGSRLGLAVALNQAVVPRSRWAATALRDGDMVEIVGAKQGG